MSLTLGLNTAISGLMTNQKQLDIVAQNVSNVNTPGYTRKVLNQESRVLAGFGAGVQTASIQRSVDQGLLKHLRTEQGKLADVKAVDQYLERLSQVFGTPADNVSIAHIVATFKDSLEALSNQVTKQTSYLGTVRSAQDVTELINRTAAEIQQLRTDADKRIAEVVNEININVGEIDTLNDLIIKNNATGAGTADLEDKRDAAISKLAEYVDITYYGASDGGTTVYTAGGMLLVDTTPQTVSHNAVSRLEAVGTKAGGGLDGIMIGGIDITADITSGELKGLLRVRDDLLTNFQAGLDQLSAQLMDKMNVVHNRGTAFPTAVSTMTGTRTFAEQTNLTQRIHLGGTTEDTRITVFDSAGEQVASEALGVIMNTDYGAGDLDPQGLRGWWTIDQVSAHMQAWLQASGYPSAASASVGLNSDGKLAIDLGNPDYTLAFRDQAAGAAGSAAGDVSIEFDVDGDSVGDQTVAGFSSFFGLNDLFVTNKHNSIVDSAILPASTTTANVSRTVRFYDETGQLGTSVTLQARSSLDQVAAAINKFSVAYDTAKLDVGYTVPAGLVGEALSVSLPSGTVGTYVAALGDDLTDVATAITAMGFTATVVSDNGTERLRVTNADGSEVSFGGSLATEWGFEKRQLVEASIVPEGAGSRLRIVHKEGGELFIAADQDVSGNSLLTDLKMGPAAVARSESVTINQTLVDAPDRVSRGAVQYNSLSGAYYIHDGDNTTALAMAAAATDKSTIDAAGGIGRASFSLTEYAASLTSLVATEGSVAKDRLSYQSNLNDNVKFQSDSISGVNVDEEVASLITYQQAYAASAKIISALQEMLEVLTNIIK